MNSVCYIFSLVASFFSPAALAADADHGLALAQRWCATCHVVTSDQRIASADAPSFTAIAKKSGFSEQKLVSFLLEPHPKMPNMSLSRTEASDIAGYIATLAK